MTDEQTATHDVANNQAAPGIVIKEDDEHDRPRSPHDDENGTTNPAASAAITSTTINALDLAGNNETAVNAAVAGTGESITTTSGNLNASANSLNSNEAANSSYEKEIVRLREIIAEKESELGKLDARLNETEKAARANFERLNQQFSAKLEESIRTLKESSQRDKNSMVMKYVEGEKKCIELNRQVELMQAKLADAVKERQRVSERLETTRAEMDKLNVENDKKLKEVMVQKKEIERLREQLVLSDARDKAAQLKLTKELEAHLITRRQLESANAQLIQLKNLETTAASNDEGTEKPAEQQTLTNEETPSQETALASDSSETTKPKEQQTSTATATTAAAKPSVVEKNDKTIRELVALKSQLKDMFEERTTLRDRLQCMEQERKLQDMSLSKYKETLQSQKQMNKDLMDEILQLRESQETLLKEQKEKKQLEEKLSMLTFELSELQAEMKLSQEKQSELLSFTAKLTEKNTQLQSENNNLKEKLQQLEAQLTQSSSSIKDVNESLKSEVRTLKENVLAKTQEVEKLANELAEAKKQCDELTTKLSDERDELASLKKKHTANMKDMTKQLQALQKRAAAQQQAASSSSSQTSANTTMSTMPPQFSGEMTTTSSMISRENSIGSLADNTSSSTYSKDLLSGLVNNATSNQHTNHHHPHHQHHDDETDRYSIDSSSRYQHEVSCDGTMAGVAAGSGGGGVGNGNAAMIDDVYVFDIDKQKLVDKIVKLQRKLAKSNEKIDFMQDHINQLTTDSKRKTRIIQAYAMKEETGAFTSEAQDAIKREMSKKTGIMSTLYNTNKSYMQTANFIKSNESNMTMELCLEINAKLQALLEDTLIKNITLKESLETLGTEIARLSKENRQIHLKE